MGIDWGGIGHALQYNPISESANYLWNSTVGLPVAAAKGQAWQKNLWGDIGHAFGGKERQENEAAVKALDAAVTKANAEPVYQKKENVYTSAAGQKLLGDKIGIAQMDVNRAADMAQRQGLTSMASRGMVGSGQDGAMRRDMQFDRQGQLAGVDATLRAQNAKAANEWDLNEEQRATQGQQFQDAYTLRQAEIQNGVNAAESAAWKSAASTGAQILARMYGQYNQPQQQGGFGRGLYS